MPSVSFARPRKHTAALAECARCVAKRVGVHLGTDPRLRRAPLGHYLWDDSVAGEYPTGWGYLPEIDELRCPDCLLAGQASALAGDEALSVPVRLPRHRSRLLLGRGR